MEMMKLAFCYTGRSMSVLVDSFHDSQCLNYGCQHEDDAGDGLEAGMEAIAD